MIKIPIESLDRSIIFSIIEEFVLREGTDYGAYEVNFQSKIDEVYRKLESDEYSISYDESTESGNLKKAIQLDKNEYESEFPEIS